MSKIKKREIWAKALYKGLSAIILILIALLMITASVSLSFLSDTSEKLAVILGASGSLILLAITANIFGADVIIAAFKSKQE